MEFKNNTKHRYKTIQGLRSFKDALPTKVKNIIIKKGNVYSKILDNWRYVVGDELFEICYPKSFKNSNRFGDSYLNIMVKRGREVELEYSKKVILQKINNYFDGETVKRIKLTTFDGDLEKTKEKRTFKTVTKNRYIKKISGIKNDKIKKSLSELSKFFNKK